MSPHIRVDGVVANQARDLRGQFGRGWVKPSAPGDGQSQPAIITPSTGSAGKETGMFSAATRTPASERVRQTLGTRRARASI